MNDVLWNKERNVLWQTHIIGLTGKAGSGKDTVCEIIQQQFPSVGIFALASELKRIATDEFGWNGEKDPNGRKLLQLLGTECGRMYGGENFWINKWKSKVKKWRSNVSWNDDHYPIVLCSDVRFDNEAQAIKDMGGKIIKVEGRAYDMGNNQSHASENGINPDLVNFVIPNTMSTSLEDLKISVVTTLINLGIKFK